MDDASFTVAILSKDSERTIERCLSSVRTLGFTTRTIVADTGSKDGTLEIVRGAARSSGVELVQIPWEDYFSRARNHVLSQVGKGWVLFLDSDEWIRTSADRAGIDSSRALWAPTIIDAPSGEAYPPLPRIVDASRIRYRGRVHEYPVDVRNGHASPGMGALSQLVLEHDGYGDDANRGEKAARNLRLLRREIAEEPLNPRWQFFRLRDGHETLREAELEGLVESFCKANQADPADTYTLSQYRTFALKLLGELVLDRWEPESGQTLAASLSRSGNIADALYFEIVSQVHLLSGRQLESWLLRLRDARRDSELMSSSYLSTRGDHLDAVIGLILFMSQGIRQANDHLDHCQPWSDAFFDSSRFRFFGDLRLAASLNSTD